MAVRLASLLIGLALFWPGQAYAGPAFLRNLTDVPLMAGLTENPNQGLVFDTAEGRVIEAVAEGAVKGGQVRDYYAAALPELGWSVDLTGMDPSFSRAREVLVLHVDDGPRGQTYVRFTLRPITQKP